MKSRTKTTALKKKNCGSEFIFRNGTKPCATNGVLFKKLLDYKNKQTLCQVNKIQGGEAKDSALLSSRDAALLEPPERPQGCFLRSISASLLPKLTASFRSFTASSFLPSFRQERAKYTNASGLLFLAAST